MSIAHLVGVPGSGKGHQTDLRTINTLSHTHTHTVSLNSARTLKWRLASCPERGEGRGGRGTHSQSATSLSIIILGPFCLRASSMNVLRWVSLPSLSLSLCAQGCSYHLVIQINLLPFDTHTHSHTHPFTFTSV